LLNGLQGAATAGIIQQAGNAAQGYFNITDPAVSHAIDAAAITGAAAPLFGVNSIAGAFVGGAGVSGAQALYKVAQGENLTAAEKVLAGSAVGAAVLGVAGGSFNRAAVGVILGGATVGLANTNFTDLTLQLRNTTSNYTTFQKMGVVTAAAAAGGMVGAGAGAQFGVPGVSAAVGATAAAGFTAATIFAKDINASDLEGNLDDLTDLATNLSSVSLPSVDWTSPTIIATATVGGAVVGARMGGTYGAIAGGLAGGAGALISQGNLTATESIIAAGITGAATGAVTGFKIAGPKGAAFGGIFGGMVGAGSQWYILQQSVKDTYGLHVCWTGRGSVSYDTRFCPKENFYELSTRETTYISNKRGTFTVEWQLHNGIVLHKENTDTRRLTSRFLKQGKTLQETALIGPLQKCMPTLDAPFARHDVFPHDKLYKCLLDYALPLNPRFISYELHPTA
jgi:hypothetical protein